MRSARCPQGRSDLFRRRRSAMTTTPGGGDREKRGGEIWYRARVEGRAREGCASINSFTCYLILHGTTRVFSLGIARTGDDFIFNWHYNLLFARVRVAPSSARPPVSAGTRGARFRVRRAIVILICPVRIFSFATAAGDCIDNTWI